METPHVIVLMGVTGSGKTTVGRALATTLGWVFHDADDLHPPANIRKMKRGDPLDDEDRAPWLAAVRALVVELAASQRKAVLACSALKESYRKVIVGKDRNTTIVYLRGSPEFIATRLADRTDHFMPNDLLRSQFDDLEEPEDAIVIEISQNTRAIVNEILERTHLTVGLR